MMWRNSLVFHSLDKVTRWVYITHKIRTANTNSCPVSSSTSCHVPLYTV
jgi:hypothetical protein